MTPTGIKQRDPRSLTIEGLCQAGRRFGGLRENDSRGGTRTPDPVINSHLLYHLSYSGMNHER